MIIIGRRLPPMWHLRTLGREVHIRITVLYKNCTFIIENTQI